MAVRTCAWPLALAIALTGLAIGAVEAEVKVTGAVSIYNEATGRYEPLRHARVRLVLGEYADADTGDVEGQTGDFGGFTLKKGNPWWRDAYDAFVILFAEVPDKLEVQSYYMQVDGYQARTGQFAAPQNSTITRDVFIGGAQQNVTYRLGGIAALGNAESVNETRGKRAFFIFHESTDHRLQLQAKRLGSSSFEEKEISYPVDRETGQYIGVLDYIRMPDGYFEESGKYHRASLACRHELSHGIMADELVTWPSWWNGFPGAHTLDKVSDHYGWAWSEAWAEFMAEVTQAPRYGMHNDFETQDGCWQYSDGTRNPNASAESSWRKGIPQGADRARVEGEVASAIWDIYDPTGWEICFTQYADLPEKLEWYDGLSDPNLDKIWMIFSDHHPLSFTHGTHLGSPDSFIHYWLNESKLGYTHELKAILWNRGIRFDQVFTQRAPLVAIGEPAWSANVARIPVTVGERDPEDRPHLRVLVYVNGARAQIQEVAGWNGDRAQILIEQPIAWLVGAPNPVITIVAHDNMEAAFVKKTLTPPDSARVGGILAEIARVRVQRFIEPPALMPPGKSFPTVDLSPSLQTSLTARVMYGGAMRVTELPPNYNKWTINKSTDTTIPGPWEIHRIERLDPLRFVFQFNALALGGGGSWVVQATADLGPAENFGLGERTAVMQHTLTREQSGFSWVECTVITVDYRISGFPPTPSGGGGSGGGAPSVATAQPVTGPGLAGMQVVPRALPQLAVAAPLAGAKLATPSGLLAQVSRLSDDYARLQGELTASAQELQVKLEGPPPQAALAPIPAATQPAVRGPAAGRTVAGRPTLQTTVLALPQTPFLDRASVDPTAIKLSKLSVAQVEHLTALGETVRAGDARLGEIETRSQSLRAALDAALQRMGAIAGMDATALQTIQTRLEAGKQRLAEVSASVGDFRVLAAKQKVVIERGLTLPR